MFAFLGKVLKLRGVRIILSLDNWLLMASSMEEDLRANKFLFDLTYFLGYIVLKLENRTWIPHDRERI